MVQKLGDTASEAGMNNVAFMANFVLGNLEECLDILVKTKRLPEAAFFARTYLPSEISRILPLWKAELVNIPEILSRHRYGFPNEKDCHRCAGYQLQPPQIIGWRKMPSSEMSPVMNL